MWHTDFIKKALQNPVINDAYEYGVEITQASNSDNWRIIGIHHLTGEENRGGYHLYLEALDQDGNRVPKSFVGWTWEGRQLRENADPAVLDKPLNEPAGNIGLGAPQTVQAWMLGLGINDRDSSDVVTGIHTRHADEEAGNTWGHHSFYVVWQQTDVIIPVPVEKPLDHYVLVDLDWVRYVAVSQWVVEQKMTVGFNVQEAMLARKVTAIGVAGHVVNDLILSGTEVTEINSECALADEFELAEAK